MSSVCAAAHCPPDMALHGSRRSGARAGLRCAVVQELGAPVEYIVLPTFAYEHKIFVGPFSRRFPKAQVWVAPRCGHGGPGERRAGGAERSRQLHRLEVEGRRCGFSAVRVGGIPSLPHLHPLQPKGSPKAALRQGRRRRRSFLPFAAPPRPAPARSQWSWPINLPVQFFGIFPTGVIKDDATGVCAQAGEGRCAAGRLQAWAAGGCRAEGYAELC